MTNFSKRLELMEQLGTYLLADGEDWQQAKLEAYRYNPWFIHRFTGDAVEQICKQYLDRAKLEAWLNAYPRAAAESHKTVGIVMAGNIPLVGFHDFLCTFLCGHRMKIKLSSKDDILLTHLIKKLLQWDPALAERILISDRLNGCDAYIATGSNNSARYFEYYFSRYPHLIRRNRTSVAILDSSETTGELESLADDVMMYFGLGCRNVTQVFVPEEYDFVALLDATDKYSFMADHNRYKNNLDYRLALLILNNIPYMSRPQILMVEDPSAFSPISVLHYSSYQDLTALRATLSSHPDIQCIMGKGGIPFGKSQQPSLSDYSDGVDTMAFLEKL